MGRIDVVQEEEIIRVTMSGPLDRAAVTGMRDALLGLLSGRSDGLLLYDSRAVELSDDLAIANQLQDVDEALQPRLRKVASVVPDYLVGSRAGVIHVYSKNHERFYDVDSARKWLLEP